MPVFARERNRLSRTQPRAGPLSVHAYIFNSPRGGPNPRCIKGLESCSSALPPAQRALSRAALPGLGAARTRLGEQRRAACGGASTARPKPLPERRDTALPPRDRRPRNADVRARGMNRRSGRGRRELGLPTHPLKPPDHQDPTRLPPNRPGIPSMCPLPPKPGHTRVSAHRPPPRHVNALHVSIQTHVFLLPPSPHAVFAAPRSLSDRPPQPYCPHTCFPPPPTRVFPASTPSPLLTKVSFCPVSLLSAIHCPNVPLLPPSSLLPSYVSLSSPYSRPVKHLPNSPMPPLVSRFPPRVSPFPLPMSPLPWPGAAHRRGRCRGRRARAAP